MRYDPDRHHRRSIRLLGYDYCSAGAYFVTVCTHRRELLFEDPVLRRVAETMWQRIPRHFPNVQLDGWVVMPNHVHGIVVITDDPCRGETSPETVSSAHWSTSNETGSTREPITRDVSPLRRRPIGAPAGSLGIIVGNFKSVTARHINRLRRTPGAPVWQRNYYEHVVRDERALDAIRQYIAGNPARWVWDTYNPSATGPDPQAADLWCMLQAQA